MQHEIDFSASTISYRTAEGDRKIESTRASVNYRANVVEGLDLSIGGGFESLRDSHPDTALFNFALLGKMGDKLKTHIGFTRDVIDDTTASLTRNIIEQSVKAGIGFDPFSRLLVGGEYEVRDYSDSNQIKGYELWASYILFKDPTLLKFSYAYHFEDSQEGNMPGTPLDDGFAINDHPYWAPKNYWANCFSLHFKHQLSDDLLGRGIPRYYTAGYSVEYDSGGRAIQTVEGGFFVEWTPHILLETKASITSSEVYRNKEFFLSAAYRW